MNEHTPGPWRATAREVDPAANWGSRIPFAIEVAHHNLVAPIADVCAQPHAAANARLIAAAPDLLAALRATTEALHEYTDTCEALDAGFAAIARATALPTP